MPIVEILPLGKFGPMGWFGKPRGVTPDELQAVRDEVRRLRADWQEWEDRLSRLYDRSRKAVARRIQKEDAADASGQTELPELAPLSVPPGGHGPMSNKAHLRRLAASLRGGNGNVPGR